MGIMIRRLSLLLLSGCIANNGLGSLAESQDNIWGLSRLCVGMTESQVLQIMRYPYSKKTLECDGNSYNFWFYVTRPVGLDQSRLVRQNLTPLAFENGVLLGWGHDFYRYILSELEHPKTPGESRAKPTDRESKSLERVIEGIESKPQPKSSSSVETSQNQKMDKPKSNESSSKKNDNKTKNDKKKKENGSKNSKDPLDDEDRKMIEEENNQNFDFW